jgi:heme exporter protein A
VNISLQPHNFSGLSVSGIEFWRGDRRVLAEVSLELGATECLHLLGPNGSGKTTLLRVITGLLSPEQGVVAWGGRDTRTDRDGWRGSFSYLGHNDGLKPELTAGENLAFETSLRRRLQDGEVDAALAQVGLAAAGDMPAGILSAGQRRRLAMARVMLAAVPLWMLDEPYTNLDAGGSTLVAGLIGRHLAAGGAAIIAAHQALAIPGHTPRRLELT